MEQTLKKTVDYNRTLQRAGMVRAGTSILSLNITSEFQTEMLRRVGTDGIPPLLGNSIRQKPRTSKQVVTILFYSRPFSDGSFFIFWKFERDCRKIKVPQAATPGARM